MRWQDQFAADSRHLTLCFIVDIELTKQNVDLVVQPTNIKKKNTKMEEFEACNLTKEKSICVFLLHIESMPRIMHPDVWTRVKAENVSIRHV